MRHGVLQGLTPQQYVELMELKLMELKLMESRLRELIMESCMAVIVRTMLCQPAKLMESDRLWKLMES